MAEIRRINVEYFLTEDDVAKMEELLTVCKAYEKDGKKPFEDMSLDECFEMIITNGWRNELESRIRFMRSFFER